MWKKQYKKKKFYWGLKPESGLKEAIKYAQKGKALDIGAGEGRNSIFLARNGFEVEVIDRIKEGLEKCNKFAKEYKLSIKTQIIDVKKFKFIKDRYSLILSIVALDFLRFSEFRNIIKKIKNSLKEKGVFYLVVFSKKDPTFKFCQKRGVKMVEKDTFYFPKDKIYRHYFKKRELLNLLKDLKFKIINIEEKNKRNTHEKVHFHHIIRIIVKK